MSACLLSIISSLGKMSSTSQLFEVNFLATNHANVCMFKFDYRKWIFYSLGFEKEPKLPPRLTDPLYDVMLNNNLNPVKVHV